ncbi:MAG: (Fe-S)-binding protein [Proteobacteria bacterium]|nr:(Fe-S)-binding protein [Pseudomonadota bacterium]
MAHQTYIDAFVPAGKDVTACVSCGLCLQKCPVMKMGKEESKAEIKRLLNDETPMRVLNECTFCYSCNHYCPKGLKPYALFLERMAAKLRENGQGIPASIEYMFTGKHESGYFFDMYNAAPEEDKAILKKWKSIPARSKDVLFIGCTGRTIPKTIEYAKALKSLPKYAPRDACCGEIPYRMGDYESFVEIVDRTRKHLDILDAERLVCYCGSCSNYFGHFWPECHGVELPYKVISLWEWLWEKYNTGEITIKRSVGTKVALTDSCYSSELGDAFYEAVRGLHEAAGMPVVELENNRYDSLCCGFASGIRDNFENKHIKIEAKKKFDQILQTEAKDVSCYCPGCWLNLGKLGEKHNINIHYAMNKILWAFEDGSPNSAG